jgi:hypothetical protein
VVGRHWTGADRFGQHEGVTDPRKSAEQAVEVLLYAPIGFALEARKLLPTFVDRGRQQVQMARMIGQFAVGQGQVEAAKRLERAQSQAHRQARTILAELGLAADGGAVGGGDRSDHPVPASPDTTLSAPPVPAPAAPQASAASADLAIAGYDALAASHVIPRLAGLGPEELEAVRRYESAHRARKTILGRIAQLQGD